MYLYRRLKDAIEEGKNSGIAHDFNPQKHLNKLKANKKLQSKI